ncbi:hypothetical protein M0813_00375 [Anaeramoeba flamelloides]|uniref:Uncharacterized protein n=1 Tax=Anaeramoeba flamelloides TaxID=1746091 RepID=A0AAV7YLH9_9EUKA|nr:hypothetical protein M0812_25921 [Anaeramoeba flamelloides]KAJ3434575.1 hypothetical protein M0812_01693 [Anaeramoeba flamelloides]KAJ6231257.1 hypothetical protein M0813_05986 [Anaeramoeba flamelloides]KAJ6241671.1 hypothetical protein M0813_00375 [Anaeramoeba flamelloides]|eukprot:Anaeramoba_flamelloidesa1055830_442.p1 GENE.a1055830_442~~a1055830_442.p1  ORF type:complete len:180 (+),score=47.94 a1055830_442:31-570(+)
MSFADIEVQSELLDFEIISCDGGEYSSSYAITNLLRDDSSVYSSKEKFNVNLILKSKKGSFFLTDIIAKAPMSGYTAPMGPGLIWVGDDPEFTGHKKFDNFTEEKYKKFLVSKEEFGQEDPVIFFDISGAQCTESVNCPWTGEYVLVKMISSQKSYSNDNIDFQYLGLKGQLTPTSGDN